MADQEVIKHTKKIYKVWNRREHSFWHKTKEFMVEIAIIVFAISLSIWFHSWSEHRHEQAAVQEFLTGLKKDLQADMSEIESDKQSYKMQKAAYSYITKTRLGEHLNPDSVNHYYLYIFNATGLKPNNGRFEGFKSSGKMGTIEDEALQNDIMDLYQENIPMLISTTDLYVSKKKGLYDFIQKNKKRLTDSTTNFSAILNTEEAHNICEALTGTNEITDRYGETLQKMKKIIEVINKEYHLAD